MLVVQVCVFEICARLVQKSGHCLSLFECFLQGLAGFAASPPFCHYTPRVPRCTEYQHTALWLAKPCTLCMCAAHAYMRVCASSAEVRHLVHASCRCRSHTVQELVRHVSYRIVHDCHLCVSALTVDTAEAVALADAIACGWL